MSAYIIKEVPNVNADTTAITTTVNGSLSAAKRTATRQQTFKGTVMKIENTRGVLIAYWKGGKWFDTDNTWAH